MASPVVTSLMNLCICILERGSRHPDAEEEEVEEESSSLRYLAASFYPLATPRYPRTMSRIRGDRTSNAGCSMLYARWSTSTGIVSGEPGIAGERRNSVTILLTDITFEVATLSYVVGSF